MTRGSREGVLEVSELANVYRSALAPSCIARCREHPLSLLREAIDSLPLPRAPGAQLSLLGVIVSRPYSLRLRVNTDQTLEFLPTGRR